MYEKRPIIITPSQLLLILIFSAAGVTFLRTKIFASNTFQSPRCCPIVQGSPETNEFRRCPIIVQGSPCTPDKYKVRLVLLITYIRCPIIIEKWRCENADLRKALDETCHSPDSIRFNNFPDAIPRWDSIRFNKHHPNAKAIKNIITAGAAERVTGKMAFKIKMNELPTDIEILENKAGGVCD